MKKPQYIVMYLLAGAVLILAAGAAVRSNPVGTYQIVIGPDYYPDIEGSTTCPYVLNTQTGEVWSVSIFRDELNQAGGYSWHCFGSPESQPGYLGTFGEMRVGQFSAYQENAKLYLRKIGVGQFPNDSDNRK